MPKAIKKIDKNKTLTGLLIKSKSSGAVYFWNRALQKVICVSDSKHRPFASVTPIFQDSCFGFNKKNKVVYMDSYPNYIILEEIHNLKLKFE